MTAGWDVIVVGLGGMGSAGAAHLASRGLRVLGLEQFQGAHDRGSSHGNSRIIRQAYFENPAYVPLLRRSYELYGDLNADDPGIFVQTGGLMMGSAGSAAVAGSLASAREWDLPHRMLDAGDIRRHFPTFTPTEDTVALYEERGGFVRPERTVLAHLRRATREGADLRSHQRVSGWSADRHGVTVTTADETFRADRLVLTPGAWAPDLLADLHPPLRVERQLLFWFQPVSGVGPFALGRAPIFIWESPSGQQLYGFPAIDGPGGGVKVAFYRNGRPADPDRLDRDIHSDEVEQMRRHLAGTVPALAGGTFLRGRACMYTCTPDLDFVIGTHPRHENVVVSAGFSGHGFKFVPVVGEIIADLACRGSTEHPIDLFAVDRFGGDGSAS
ncbi:N-methyl-L-tryptophan oxidase [Nakamurella endophytica]|uniref:N-methyltryptophan oxidase n=1 Tax=Nakamurella endophytica TaxID=1748367 RepID=A0A917WMZ1_9ACTN|nr:N-methyl-L-tryptophan oxidase [Nakamurella endophytica]GGM17500.1 N-methyltryptophan oxidase [Nakamurella endophytica]